MKLSCWMPTHVGGPLHKDEDARDRARLMIEYAKRAEASGYESIWTEDHILALTHPLYRGMSWLDSLISLAYVASHTTTLKLGTIYTACLRNPVVAAKEIASLMHLAPGRFVLGITIGYGGGEHEAAGISKSERGRRTDEWMDALELLLTTENASYDGRYYKFDDVTINPLPPAMPTLWVAAAGVYFDPEVSQDQPSIKTRVIDRVLRSEGWIISATASPEKASQDWERIADRAQERGIDASGLYITHGNHMHVVDTHDRQAAYEEQRPLWNPHRSRHEDFEYMSEKVYLNGSIDDIIAKLRLRADIGTQELLAFAFDGHSMEQLDLWAKHIMPVIADW